MIDLSLYNSISNRMQDATDRSLIFYKITNDEAVKVFNERIAQIEETTIVINRDIKALKTHHNVIVLDIDTWYSEKRRAAEYFYPITKNIFQVGITGTNGKTTTAYLAMCLTKFWSKKSLYIGTLGVYRDKTLVESSNLTTPDIIDYRRIVSKYQEEIQFVFVEVSSHALEQNRLDGIYFAVSGWTSFSQDHLDYHGSIQAYFEAKEMIVKITQGKLILGEKIESLNFDIAHDIPNYSYSNPFLGLTHNRKNFNLAYSLVLECLKNEPSKVLDNSFSVPGRFEIVSCTENNVDFIIDYAHTPDAVDRILSECRETWPSRKIITLIGCGGERDRSKRSMMATSAINKSDYVIFTEDNSRGENIDIILSEMLSGPHINEKTTFEVIKERKKAIKHSLSMLDTYKLIVILGKGEEDYIDRGTELIEHNDKNFVKKIIAND